MAERGKILVPKQIAIELVEEDYDGTEYEVVLKKITGNSRWSIENDLVIKEIATGKFGKTNYRYGATENQDEGPFEDDEDIIEFDEVFPVEKTIIVYK